MSFARPEYLVTTDWLAQHLDDPAVRVLECTVNLVADPAQLAGVRVDSGRTRGRPATSPARASSTCRTSCPTAPRAAVHDAAGRAVRRGDVRPRRRRRRPRGALRPRRQHVGGAHLVDAPRLRLRRRGGARRRLEEVDASKKRPVGTDAGTRRGARVHAASAPELFVDKGACSRRSTTARVRAQRAQRRAAPRRRRPLRAPGPDRGSVNVAARDLIDPATHAYLPADEPGRASPRRARSTPAGSSPTAAAGSRPAATRSCWRCSDATTSPSTTPRCRSGPPTRPCPWRRTRRPAAMDFGNRRHLGRRRLARREARRGARLQPRLVRTTPSSCAPTCSCAWRWPPSTPRASGSAPASSSRRTASRRSRPTASPRSARLAPGRIEFGVGTGFTAPQHDGPARDAPRRPARARARGAGAPPRRDRRVGGRGPRAEDPLPQPRRRAHRHRPIRSRCTSRRSARGRAPLTARDRRRVDALRGPARPPACATSGEMAEVCRAAGRTPESLYKTTFTMGCVLARRARPPTARARARPGRAVRDDRASTRVMDGSLPMRVPTAHRGRGGTSTATLYESYEPADARYLTLHRGHFMFLRPEEERFATAATSCATDVHGHPARAARPRRARCATPAHDQFAVFLAPRATRTRSRTGRAWWKRYKETTHDRPHGSVPPRRGTGAAAVQPPWSRRPTRKKSRRRPPRRGGGGGLYARQEERGRGLREQAHEADRRPDQAAPRPRRPRPPATPRSSTTARSPR